MRARLYAGRGRLVMSRARHRGWWKRRAGHALSDMGSLDTRLGPRQKFLDPAHHKSNHFCAPSMCKRGRSSTRETQTIPDLVLTKRGHLTNAIISFDECDSVVRRAMNVDLACLESKRGAQDEGVLSMAEALASRVIPEYFTRTADQLVVGVCFPEAIQDMSGPFYVIGYADPTMVCVLRMAQAGRAVEGFLKTTEGDIVRTRESMESTLGLHHYGLFTALNDAEVEFLQKLMGTFKTPEDVEFYLLGDEDRHEEGSDGDANALTDAEDEGDSQGQPRKKRTC